MGNLIVRNVDDDIVSALKERAGKYGISAEAAHRLILEEALMSPKKKSIAKILASMPNVGEDSDFERNHPKENLDVFN